MNDGNSVIQRYRSKALGSGLLVMLNSIFGIVPLCLSLRLVMALLEGSVSDVREIWTFGGLICASLALKAIFYGLSVWKVHDVAYSCLADVRLSVLERLKSLPIAFFQRRKGGDLVNVISHDVEQVELYLAHGLPEMINAVALPLAIAVMMFTVLDWRLGLALILPIPFAVALAKVVERSNSEVMRRFQGSMKRTTEDLVEYISTMPVIKAFGRDESRTERILEDVRTNARWVKRASLGMHVPMGLILLVMESGVAAAIVTACYLLMEGSINGYEYLLTIALVGAFTGFFLKLHVIQYTATVFNRSVESINSVLEAQDERRDGLLNGAVAGEVRFEDVDFGYDDKGKVLKKVNLSFGERTMNGVIGPSGAGKSTIASLLMGFWRGYDGKITIGGVDIGRMTEDNLLSLVSVVQQEVFLFNLSVEENIRLGKEDATREEVIAAAKKARIHDGIMALPKGYDTVVGEGGASLSGGEKQRISIARMILKDTPIVVFDEATAAIDPYNEHLIQMAIDSLTKDKTVIVIAHNLNSVKNADQIVVMKDGMVEAKGKHRELLETSPLYREMFEAQVDADRWRLKEVTAC
ncbi:ABC transporter ATP-binding protein [Dethiosulfovibrio salsuginis]|uniref:ATP-binding cassette, subfamily B n=1 Tax=Dethiosulfovibrio salsuginis TaxID=561720 RepID=A0A1X7IKV6_9BACT|nr:ABC transporter ATP-binding protein [Dethiosulfovibrio salsuginis]SMG15544.1 ATP-binding cassette, subfamily B [Dethiosulfovibrio salsuginis]